MIQEIFEDLSIPFFTHTQDCWICEKLYTQGQCSEGENNMKILGISGGTKNGANDCMCKEALLAAKEQGAENEKNAGAAARSDEYKAKVQRYAEAITAVKPE